MNKTEVKALLWMRKAGYRGIAFQHRHSPDFVTESGTGFEVKKLRRNTIVFSSHQWAELENHPNVSILIFGDGKSPEAIIPFQQLKRPPSYWQNYRLIIVDLVAMRYEAEAKHIRDLRARLKLSAKAFAEKVGVLEITVKRWENGEARPSQLARRQLKRLARKG